MGFGTRASFFVGPGVSSSCLRISALRSRSRVGGALVYSLKRLVRYSTQQQAAKSDYRNRLSKVWAPTGGVAVAENEDSHSKLVRAGFLRQAHSGVFHMLPLGLRVQNKLEALVDKYMLGIGASKVSLSSISSQSLWKKSGRLAKSSELFLFKDRKDADYLLAPTHEEEITSLVASTLASYKDVPIKLYQTSRKYRDELRPRQGLLRGREFIMKDLYTFDLTTPQALETYDQVKEAYVGLFNELKLPYLVAEADSGDMGGNLSHEFHFPTPKGEDHIISCESCDYVANEELAEARVRPPQEQDDEICWVFSPSIRSPASSGATQAKASLWRGISRDRKTLVNVWYPYSAEAEVNAHAVKAIFSGLDSGVEDPIGLWLKEVQKSSERPGAPINAPTESIPEFINIFDSRIPLSFQREIIAGVDELNPLPPNTPFKSSVLSEQILKQPLYLTRVQTGDACPRCADGHLEVEKSIELGHTFFLGTRYSKPLEASVLVPAEKWKEVPKMAADEVTASSTSSIEVAKSNEIESKKDSVRVDLQMGCHGIGITRMIGAIAEVLSESKGLNWPRVVAPYEVVVIQARKNDGMRAEGEEVYDILTQNNSNDIDAVLDDRSAPFTFPWKLNDADLVGYPVIVVVGRGWKERKVEVQCRQLGVKEEVEVGRSREFVTELLQRL